MKKIRGFTVIEVVLVLAIAGLIFMMVFIAMPAMQRQSRDTQRKDDMMKFVQAVQKYQQNFRGTLPTGTSSSNNDWNESEMNKMDPPTPGSNWQAFWDNYIDGSFGDPQNETYGLHVLKCDKVSNSDKQCQGQDFPSMDYKIHVFVGSACQDDKASLTSNPRAFSVVYKTEGSGNYCFDSSS